MAAEGPRYSEPVSAKISADTKAQLEQAEERFGVTEGACVRMALEAFLPGYLAGQGKPEHRELLAEITSAVTARPELRSELPDFIRRKLRRAA